MLEEFSNQLDIEEDVMRTRQGAILSECQDQEHGEMETPPTLEEEVDMEDMESLHWRQPRLE